MIVKRFDSSDSNVWKYVFEFEDAVAEAVLYSYGGFDKRTVLCVSVQSGCPVGCTFCGTGKKFIRNLIASEICDQVEHCLRDMGTIENISNCDKFQIMFMSMGEPMLNIKELEGAIMHLNKIHSNAELLISTVGIKDYDAIDTICKLGANIDKVGLQFSIHESVDQKRDILIPFKNKLNLREIRDLGIRWNFITRRLVYINYCIGNHNQSEGEMNRIKDLFPPGVFNLTFSVICSADENMKDKGYRELDVINEISNSFVADGYNVRVFDPAGQDDIGGGCGQLWYVQDWMNKHDIR